MNSQRLIGVIATREFMARIRSRTFGITTALTVIAIGAYILLQAYVFNKSTTSLDVGFTTEAQAISAPVKADAASLGVTITVHPIGSTAAGQADVRSGTLDALVSGSGAGTTVTVQSAVDPTLETALNDQARQQVLTEYLTQHDLPPSDVLGQLAFSVSVNEESLVNAAHEAQIVIGLFVAGTLYITLTSRVISMRNTLVVITMALISSLHYFQPAYDTARQASRGEESTLPQRTAIGAILPLGLMSLMPKE